MKTYEIKQVANGYIVSDSHDRFEGCHASTPPHVFETFEAMSAWLECQFLALDKKTNDGCIGTMGIVG